MKRFCPYVHLLTNVLLNSIKDAHIFEKAKIYLEEKLQELGIIPFPKPEIRHIVSNFLYGGKEAGSEIA